jgi:hypothetical protein
MTTHPIIRRALAAYGWSDGEPLPTSARLHTIGGLQYVVLRRAKALLACYRVRNDDKLKRLIRLPDGL